MLAPWTSARPEDVRVRDMRALGRRTDRALLVHARGRVHRAVVFHVFPRLPNQKRPLEILGYDYFVGNPFFFSQKFLKNLLIILLKVSSS